MDELNKISSASGHSYKWEEQRIGEVPCQNCGRLVIVTLPFIGCVFCKDCQKTDGNFSWEASSEDFHKWQRK